MELEIIGEINDIEAIAVGTSLGDAWLVSLGVAQG
jgi:hypothetical protein